MAIVAGVDFGTLSVRVTLMGTDGERMGVGTAGYPLHRKQDDPEYATQSHGQHMEALTQAMHTALSAAQIAGGEVAALAVATTGSSVVMVDEGLQPLDDYAMWCDHRAYKEAREITAKAHELGIEAIAWCGGVYSHEWGWAKLLYWLRHATAEKRARFSTAVEHCDMVAATLTGKTRAAQLRRSVCAMGHKWMWNPKEPLIRPRYFQC